MDVKLKFVFLGKEYNLLAAKDDFLIKKMYYNDKFQLYEAVQSLLFSWMEDGNKYAIDMGAMIGDTSLCLAHYFKKVYMFEPNPKMKPFVDYMMKNNEAGKKIVYFPFACSNKKETLKMKVEDKDNLGSTAISKNGDIKIQSVRADKIINDNSKCGVIKVDVEGYEPEALEGAMNIIKKDLPYIFWERNESYDNRLKNGAPNLMAKIIGEFYDLGYNKLIYVPHNNYLICTERGWNVLSKKIKSVCYPEDRFKQHFCANYTKAEIQQVVKYETYCVNSKLAFSEIDRKIEV